MKKFEFKALIDGLHITYTLEAIDLQSAIKRIDAVNHVDKFTVLEEGLNSTTDMKYLMSKCNHVFNLASIPFITSIACEDHGINLLTIHLYCESGHEEQIFAQLPHFVHQEYDVTEGVGQVMIENKVVDMQLLQKQQLLTAYDAHCIKYREDKAFIKDSIGHFLSFVRT